MEKSTIEHEGTVIRVTDREVVVAIENHSACAECHAKGMCNISGSKVKEITAEKTNFPVSVGDKVAVTATTGDAMLSVLLAYILPSVLIVGILAVLLLSGGSELSAATGAILTAAAYYFILYLCRNKLERKIKFKLKEK